MDSLQIVEFFEFWFNIYGETTFKTDLSAWRVDLLMTAPSQSVWLQQSTKDLDESWGFP